MMKQWIMLVFAVILAFSSLRVQAQDTELLETKVELLKARLELLDISLRELESRPAVFKQQMDSLNAYFSSQRDSINELLWEAGLVANMAVNIEKTNYRSNLYLDPYRLFEGSLMLGYERAITRSLSLDLAFLGTFLTKGGGLGGNYFANQDLAAYNEVTRSYDPVDGDMITGWGMVLKAKKYLLTRINANSKAPLGLYAAPQLMYRNIKITGLTSNWIEDEYVQEEVSQRLDVFGGGVILGGKFTVMKVLSVDAFVGGVMRLSKYHGEDDFTRYKKWNNIDYSGVLPTAGISVGILQ